MGGRGQAGRLVCGGFALLSARVSAEEVARYNRPAFFDYDCTLPAPDWTEDWNEVHSRAVASVADPVRLRFDLSPELLRKILTGELLDGECPLGALFVTAVAALGAVALQQPSELVNTLVDLMELQLRRWPFFVVSASRWPTFEVLLSAASDLSGSEMAKQQRCPDAGESGIDWLQLHNDAVRWDDFLNHRATLAESELGPLEQRLRTVSTHAWGKARNLVQDECPFGFMYLLASRALAMSTWDTGHFESPARAVDTALDELGYSRVILSGWPVVHKLLMLSSISLQGHYQNLIDIHPKKKLFRQFSDLRLTVEELCPFGRNASGWAFVDSLARMTVSEWLEAVPSSILSRSGIRQVFAEAVSAVAAALNATRARGLEAPPSSCAAAGQPRQECGYSGMSESTCRSWGCCWAAPAAPGEHMPRCFRPAGQPRRKLVLLTPVWGQRWAGLVEPFAHWARILRLPGVVLVAMGVDVREACARAASRWGSIACWSPLAGTQADERGSLLQRHALMHVLVHLGLDVLSFDFDTFLFRNPSRRVEEVAEGAGADVLLTGHFDADCLNTGAIYVRASARSAEWYSKYLAWLHGHPYEDEQRGLNVLLNYTQQGISFRPSPMPQVRGGSLEDSNEFASSRGGWLGDWGKLHFFHFVAPGSMEALPRLAQAEADAAAGRGPRTWQELKVVDMGALYAAALGSEADLDAPSLPAQLQAADPRGSSNLSRARATMDLYLVPSAPARSACW